MQWKVYYDDSTFSDLDGPPESSQGYGGLFILQRERATSTMRMHGWNFYYWHPEDELWWGCDLQGLLDRHRFRLPLGAVIEGRSVSISEYARIKDIAWADTDFPQPSGTRKGSVPWVT